MLAALKKDNSLELDDHYVGFHFAEEDYPLSMGDP